MLAIIIIIMYYYYYTLPLIQGTLFPKLFYTISISLHTDSTLLPI